MFVLSPCEGVGGKVIPHWTLSQYLQNLTLKKEFCVYLF